MNSLDKYLLPPQPRLLSIWILAFVLLAVAVWIASLAITQFELAQAEEHVNQKLSAQTMTRPPTKSNRGEQELSHLWSEWQAEHDFPWDHVFKLLEEADSSDIELLGLLPEKKQRIVTLRGEAISSRALSTYLRAMSEQPMLSQAYLVHERVITRERLETVEFEIKLKLN